MHVYILYIQHYSTGIEINNYTGNVTSTTLAIPLAGTVPNGCTGTNNVP